MTTLQFWQAYLFGWAFWNSLSLGCVGLLCLHHAVRGSWGLPILRVLEAGARLTPIMGLAYIPIVLIVVGVLPAGGDLYPWMHINGDPILLKKTWWLNPGFFAARQIFYYVVWWLFSSRLTASELKQDRDGDLRRQQARSTAGAWGIVVFMLTVTLAYTDWIMSLDPKWYSTIFGAWYIMGQTLTALSFATIFVTTRALKGQSPWKEACTFPYRKDMGNLMLTLCMVWAYFSLSQFLIIWSGNLPEEIGYFTRRFNDIPLLAMGTLLIAFQWMIPLLFLIAPRTKRRTTQLCAVASVMIVIRWFDMFWAIVPFFMTPGHNAANPMQMVLEPSLVMMCVGTTAVFGIAWGFIFANFFKQRPPMPTHDPRLQDLIDMEVSPVHV